MIARSRWIVDPPECPYCGQFSELVDGTAIYPHRPDLARKKFFLCAPCGAWVGTHAHDGMPLGRLANAELRRAKQDAHAVFDPLWKAKARRDNLRKGHARAKAYRWLAERLGIDPKECHIGMFDVDRCRMVVEVCAPYGRRSNR